MLFNVRIIFLLFFVLFCEVSNKHKWVNRLTKYMKKEDHVYKTVLIISEDTRSQDDRVSDVIVNIQKEIPSQIISLIHANTPDAQIITRSLLHLRTENTMFIAIQFIEKNLQNVEATEATDFLNQLSESKTRPKCLMIALPMREKVRYRKLLYNMWSNYFLDFTILEMAERQDRNDLFWNEDQLIMTVYNFNPFNGIYTKRRYMKKIKLFPNKLLDLNGFEMKVGSFNFPPSIYVKRNSSGYPVEVAGTDALVAKTLSKKMNFRLSEQSSQKESIGDWHCSDESKRTGFAYLLGNNTIQFITNQAGILPNCERASLDSKCIEPVKICALVPILTSKSDTIFDVRPTAKWIYFALLILVSRIITILLKFDSDVWSWLEILRECLGFTVPREPSRLSERIAFISILIAFSLFSSSIFVMLTHTKLTKKVDKTTIDTLEELNGTNLIPMTRESYRYPIREINDSVIRAIATKSSVVSKDQECIDMLVEGKNVACILRESRALIAISEYRDGNSDPVMKIVEERVLFSCKVMHFEPKSPYVRQVNPTIQRLIQSGLLYHWEKLFSPLQRKSNQWEMSVEEKTDSISILMPLHFFIIFGCSISILVFICEFLMKYINNRIHGCILFFSEGSLS